MRGLSTFQRLGRVHLPTPLEFLPRLSRTLQGPNLFIKRDDCTGLATGGNKARKLDYLLPEAIASDATVILTHGAVQSNHVRQSAAAAASIGLACELVLEDRTGLSDASYRDSGNVLLNQVFGAQIHILQAGTDVEVAVLERAEFIRRQGGRPYVIPGGASNALGAVGYVQCALELLEQADKEKLRIDHIVHATGSCGTQAGMIIGLRMKQSGSRLLGISVRRCRAEQEAAVRSLAKDVANLFELSYEESKQDIVVEDRYVGQGYGIATQEVLEAILLVARTEGILLDPVYSGKAMAGLLSLIRSGAFLSRENVVFIHTGGTAGLFGYESYIRAHMTNPREQSEPKRPELPNDRLREA